MRCKWNLAVVILIALLSSPALPMRADPLSEKGREILKKNQHAVVTVQVVVKSTGSGGRSSESKQDLTGTIVDPSGLTVLALSACDPAEMYRRLSPDSKIEIEVSDIKILLDDATELSSEIVLRDRDLDLAFIRPKTKPANPLTAVDLSKSGPADVLDEVITLNRLNKAASRAYAASVERISAVIQKPRTFYIPGSDMTSTTLGCPAFLPDGKLLGVFVMRAVGSGAGGSANYRQNLTSIILPAEDIFKAAKQAPEVKSDSEKKEESKDTAKEPASTTDKK
jgi:hypothetical protein